MPFDALLAAATPHPFEPFGVSGLLLVVLALAIFIALAAGVHHHPPRG